MKNRFTGKWANWNSGPCGKRRKVEEGREFDDSLVSNSERLR